MDLFEQASILNQEIVQASIKTPEELEQFRIRFLGSKNVLKGLFAELKNIPSERKREFGDHLNTIKKAAEVKFETTKLLFEVDPASKSANTDLSLPADNLPLGSRHPVNIVRNRIVDIFRRIGFSVAADSEMEDDWHNFSALNMPEDHPARDMQDTFYLQTNPAMLLRTHTSSVQVRVMEKQQPPIRIIMPGRVYRNETISARAHCFFHQVEGLYVDEHVSFADLLQTLDFFVKEMFGKETRIRLRPSYFPFTEPSAEVDVTCFICGGSGCNVCKHSGWVEILGCGMVDPAVLKNCNIDPEKYTGFAFGMGVERITMLRYQVKDLRLFSENDIRFLDQFKSA